MVLIFPLSASVFGENSNNICINQWIDFVSQVEVVYSIDQDNDLFVLFEGPDGHIFNYANQQIPNAALSELQFWSFALAQIIQEEASAQQEIPINECNISYTRPLDTQFMIIHLPYDSDSLNSEICISLKNRIHERVSVFLEGN
ncbi:MAG: hypothetical protein Rhims3KO_26740 [Hyphomicrobiales bacterium]